MMATYLALISANSDLPEGFSPAVEADSLEGARMKFAERLAEFDLVGVGALTFVVADEEDEALP